MQKNISLSLLVPLILVFACNGCGGNGESSGDILVGVRDFSFEVSIDPETITEEDDITIREMVLELGPHDESYAIQNQEDLDALNNTLSDNEQLSIDDLDTNTYLLIKDQSCPDYFLLSEQRYTEGLLILTFEHFHSPDAVCLDVIQEIYLVYKAAKA